MAAYSYTRGPAARGAQTLAARTGRTAGRGPGRLGHAAGAGPGIRHRGRAGLGRRPAAPAGWPGTVSRTVWWSTRDLRWLLVANLARLGRIDEADIAAEAASRRLDHWSRAGRRGPGRPTDRRGQGRGVATGGGDRRHPQHDAQTRDLPRLLAARPGRGAAALRGAATSHAAEDISALRGVWADKAATLRKNVLRIPLPVATGQAATVGAPGPMAGRPQTCRTRCAGSSRSAATTWPGRSVASCARLSGLPARARPLRSGCCLPPASQTRRRSANRGCRRGPLGAPTAPAQGLPTLVVDDRDLTGLRRVQGRGCRAASPSCWMPVPARRRCRRPRTRSASSRPRAGTPRRPAPGGPACR